MANYSNFDALALRLISNKGVAMKFVQITLSGWIDPDTGKYQETKTETPFMGVFTKPTLTELQAGLFKGLQTIILAPGQSIKNAKTSDRINFDGNDYDIKEIVTVAPAGNPILYKFGVEKR